MDALYRLGTASAFEIREALSDPPTYTAVRTHLTNLEEKGRVTHVRRGAKFIYQPVVPRDEMARNAIESLLQTFFDNSVERAVATLINREESNVTPEELERLAQIIDEARREGR
jgi:BlaI family transcriptional regulator, penicillinase repressor